jgi:hypothetical protein
VHLPKILLPISSANRTFADAACPIESSNSIIDPSMVRMIWQMGEKEENSSEKFHEMANDEIPKSQQPKQSAHQRGFATICEFSQI